jgi:hypothetical protein
MKGTSMQIRASRNMDSQTIKAFLGWIILDVVYLNNPSPSIDKIQKKVWKTFLKMIERTLEFYPTTILED